MPRRAPLALLATLLSLLVMAAASCRPAFSQDPGFPRLTGRVVDEAEVLRPDTEAALIDLLASHEAAGGPQVVVVTLSGLQGNDIADYGQRLARYWALGAESESPGVLLIVAPNERAVRIEIGPGLGDGLTSDIARTIIEREILPHAQAGDFDAAILMGARSILAAIGGGYIPSPPTEKSLEDSMLARLVVLAIAAFYLAALVYTVVKARRRRARRALEGPRPRLAPRLPAGSRGRRETAGSETSGGEGPDAAAGGGGASAGAGASGGW